jgi:enolase-phosphatase E1
VRIEDEARLIRVVLLDIEGTTTPIDFVTKRLFPYASERLVPFLRDHVRELEVQSVLRDLQAQHERDQTGGLQPPPWLQEDSQDQITPSVAYLQWLVTRDSKCTPLKSLQGNIWREGYAKGELKGEVYDDVPQAMARWKEQGRDIAIYSSGSVLAQQLLFTTTRYGDLTRHISNFFDTQTGPKAESSSYRKIAAAIGQEPAAVLFLSDAQKEVAAARSAGLRTGLCVRDVKTNSQQAGSITTFDDVFPQ